MYPLRYDSLTSAAWTMLSFWSLKIQPHIDRFRRQKMLLALGSWHSDSNPQPILREFLKRSKAYLPPNPLTFLFRRSPDLRRIECSHRRIQHGAGQQVRLSPEGLSHLGLHGWQEEVYGQHFTTSSVSGFNYSSGFARFLKLDTRQAMTGHNLVLSSIAVQATDRTIPFSWVHKN